MNNIQSVNKESLRYAAVEKVAGMLDATDIQDDKVFFPAALRRSGMYIQFTDNGMSKADDGTVLPVFDQNIPVGYQCHIVQNEVEGWGAKALWVVVCLYDYHGDKRMGGEPFSSFRIFLQQK